MDAELGSPPEGTLRNNASGAEHLNRDTIDSPVVLQPLNSELNRSGEEDTVPEVPMELGALVPSPRRDEVEGAAQQLEPRPGDGAFPQNGLKDEPLSAGSHADTVLNTSQLRNSSEVVTLGMEITRTATPETPDKLKTLPARPLPSPFREVSEGDTDATEGMSWVAPDEHIATPPLSAPSTARATASIAGPSSAPLLRVPTDPSKLFAGLHFSIDLTRPSRKDLIKRIKVCSVIPAPLILRPQEVL